jgi:hypothetical protein
VGKRKKKSERLSMFDAGGVDILTSDLADSYLQPLPVEQEIESRDVLGVKDAHYWAILRKCSLSDAHDHDTEWLKSGKDIYGLWLPNWYAIRELEALKDKFNSGENSALLDAIFICARGIIPLPDWVADNYVERYKKILKFEVRTLDDAFGSPLDKGANLNALNKKKNIALNIWSSVLIAAESGTAIDDELFEEVGKKYNVGKTLAKEYYGELKALYPDT